MQWQVKTKTLTVDKPLFMGIVNFQSPSFVEDFQNNTLTEALATIAKHQQDGAHILDIGSQSTHPKATAISPEVELNAILALLKNISQELLQAHTENWEKILISIDTYKASVAKAVLEYDCDIINDISSCSLDPAMAEILGHYKPGYILTHYARITKNPNTIEQICKDFEKKILFLQQYGLPEKNIVLDIGVGFGKTYKENQILLKQIEQLRVFNRPILLGISSKPWYTDYKDITLEERIASTIATTAILAERGIFIHRVHNIKTTALAVKIANLIGHCNNGCKPPSHTNNLERLY